jgi:ferric-dicitrate binding protein FerR (iron transport regulator)
MPDPRLEYLFDRYLHNSCTAKEEEEFMALLARPENRTAVQKLIDMVIENTGSETEMPDHVSAFILQNILKNDQRPAIPIKKGRTVFSFWVRIAAAVILFLAGAIYWISSKKYPAETKVTAMTPASSPIRPGGNRAVLVTSDGSTIVLDSVQNGTISQQGNAKINKQAGLLVYDISAFAKPGIPAVYNTLSTPKGGQYQVVLSDGSKVWLNAASSLHFPTAFTDSQRLVELTGEGYFEVAKNREKPFLVKVGDVQIKVLGTHFNVNAYEDESAVKTSLLEGSVKITKGRADAVLKPGEQAVANNKDARLEIGKADMDAVMAWKNGLFQFEGADITTIMKEIGRWYNVEIVYAANVPIRQFEGKISRSAQLFEVLRILELSNVKFTVVGNKIIVQ